MALPLFRRPAARSVKDRRAAETRGRAAEAACVAALEAAGWALVAERFRPPRGQGAGEIDLIARRGRVLAFIEVKAREAETDAAESVTPRQQQRIARAAELFLALHPDLAELDCRFDVMLVTPGKAPKHIEDAWRPGL
ncbi:YraN family protein [Caenispirillum salinarum]|uniref:YraN family protein n=1 Tax=Caenispirillum salinarum TaxID=859058 RepID=UPI00384F95E8